MTPERIAWWTGLPEEEKIIRNEICREMQEVTIIKRRIARNKEYEFPKWYFGRRLKEKRIHIKALRKQIAMNTVKELRYVGKADGIGDCPHCGCAVAYWHAYCSNCGQKLRWEQ